MNKQIKIGLILVIIVLLILISLLYLKDRDKDNKGDSSTQSSQESNVNKGDEVMERNKVIISIDDHELTATLYDNSSTLALVEELKKGSITIDMSDYAKMEKVGDLDFDLPRNDEEISTSAGDLILYQGNKFVIYYGENHWSLTRLGKIDNVNAQELKNILGNGGVTIQLSLK